MSKTSSESNSAATFVFWPMAASMLLLWLSFPPIGLWYLGWVALIPAFQVVIDQRTLAKNDYRKIWVAGLLYWLGTFYFIPIPHPALWAGWIVISIYLACYLPVFVGSARSLSQRFKLPYVISIPVCWTGLEYVRCHLFTGMGLVCHSHSQYQIPAIIQVSDLFGAYTLTFAMTIFSVAVWQLRHVAQGQVIKGLAHLLVCFAVMGGLMLYGNSKLYQDNESKFENLKVGLIQGSVDAVLPSTEEEHLQFHAEKSKHYHDLYLEAANQWQSVDVIIWPENGWPVTDLHPDTNKSLMDPQQLHHYDENAFYAWTSLFVANQRTPPIITGALTYQPIDNDSYGSALWIDENGEIKGRYYKNHLVMFGEYVPLADWFPLLRRIPAIGKGLMAGTEATTFEIKGIKLAPNICFESTVPHFIRNQVLQLQASGNDADVLVNLTNDGWFYGTSCLDFHLACNVFRAVEMRRPMIVCANTGFSAHIDQRGQIIKQGPRREKEAILTEVSAVHFDSPYLTIGDWVPFCFAVIAGLGFATQFLPMPRKLQPDATQ